MLSVYFFLLLAGAFGFVAMTVLGLGHGFSGHLTGHHSTGAVGMIRHGSGAPHARAASVGARSHRGKSSLDGGNPWRFLLSFSPIDLFSIMFGAGAVGVLLKAVLHNWELTAGAILGGAVFSLGIVRPLMSFLLKFASRPSEGLEGEVSSIGEATTRFDSTGKGVIKLILDEQVVQLLATLETAEIEKKVQVQKGDKVIIVAVDATRNRCTVSRELAPSPEESYQRSEQETQP